MSAGLFDLTTRAHRFLSEPESGKSPCVFLQVVDEHTLSEAEAVLAAASSERPLLLQRQLRDAPTVIYIVLAHPWMRFGRAPATPSAENDIAEIKSMLGDKVQLLQAAQS
jgi:hypothetical protein